MTARHIYTVTGQVQGVGFRPFIYREAERLELTGFVGNTPEGVRIEVQGEREALEQFAGFAERLPPLARIASLQRTEASPVADEHSFVIHASHVGSHLRAQRARKSRHGPL